MSFSMPVLEDNTTNNNVTTTTTTTTDTTAGKIASVYSSAEIARHQNRMLQLQLLESDQSDDNDESVNGDDEKETLDVNIRIFEDTGSVCDNITGEILCKLRDYIGPSAMVDSSSTCSPTSADNTTTTIVSNNSSLNEFKVVFKANFEKKIPVVAEEEEEGSLKEAADSSSITMARENGGDNFHGNDNDSTIDSNNIDSNNIDSTIDSNNIDSNNIDSNNIDNSFKINNCIEDVVENNDNVENDGRICGSEVNGIDSFPDTTTTTADTTVNKDNLRVVASRIFSASRVGMKILKNKIIRKKSINNSSPLVQMKRLYRKRLAEKIVSSKSSSDLDSSSSSSSEPQLSMFDLIFYNPPNGLKKKECDAVKTETIDQNYHDDDDDDDRNDKQTGDDKMLELDSEEQLNVKDEAMDDDPATAGIPRLMVDADGNIVIDKKSLLVESSATIKSRELIASNGILLEHGRSQEPRVKKRQHQKPWTPNETLKFYLLLSTFTTDFTQIANNFAGRTRNCVKRKYMKEEKLRPQILYKALRSSTFDLPALREELGIFDELSRKSEAKVQKAKIERAKTAAKKSPKNQKV